MVSPTRVAPPWNGDLSSSKDEAGNASPWRRKGEGWCRSGVMPSVLKGLSAADVSMLPFPHVVVENCLPGDLYDALSDAYPPDQNIVQLGSRKRTSVIGSNQRHNLRASRILGRDVVHPLWEAFVRRHTSLEFYLEVVNVFGPAIRETYPWLESRLGGSLPSLSTGLRFDPSKEKWAVSLDCQIAINTPVTVPGSAVVWLGVRTASAAACASVAFKIAGDFLELRDLGLPLWSWWNAFSTLVVLLFVVGVFGSLLAVYRELEARAAKRAREFVELSEHRRLLERELLTVSSNERNLMGQELHDDIC